MTLSWFTSSLIIPVLVKLIVCHEHGEVFENISIRCVSPEVECRGIGQHYCIYMQCSRHCLIHLKANTHRNCLKLFARWPRLIWMIFRIFGFDPFQSASVSYLDLFGCVWMNSDKKDVEDSPTAPRPLL